MLKTVIVDDDPLSLMVLKQIIKQRFKEIELVGEAVDVCSGLEVLQQTQPDLVFLDVEMPDGTGFDLLDRLGSYRFNVVFITSNVNFAIRAFKYRAIDYVLKPATIASVRETLNRLFDGYFSHVNRLVDELKSYLDQPPTTPIDVSVIDNTAGLEPKQIVRCEREGQLTRVYLLNGESLLLQQELGEFAASLTGADLVWANANQLFNLLCVREQLWGSAGHNACRSQAVKGGSR